MLKEDVENGLIPFYFGSTIGSTSSGSNDPIVEIREICN